jgi:RNA polymerase sigma-70 factor (ECF subfamily)
MAKPEPAPARAFSLQRETSLRRRLAARDEQALVELIGLATPWLLGVAQGMLSDPDEAEEVVQEAFSAAWNHTDALGDEHEALMPWLLRITRNRAIDRLRRRARRRIHLARAEASGALATGAVAAVEPNEAARPGWHVHESVHAALAALPAEQREAVELAYFRGLTHAEIARMLEIPMGTVKTRLRLAIGKLRTTLAPIKDWVQ